MSTTAWRKTRLLILRRDGYRCTLALPGCTGTATDAHHVLGRLVTGDDPAHLTAACKRCNRLIGEPKGDPSPAPATRW